MRIAAIDYGLSRTGLAVSDKDERLVFPVKTFHLAKYAKRSLMLDDVAREIRSLEAEACVLGLPLQEGKEESMMCRIIRNVRPRLQRRIPLPFYFVDEYLSSECALEDLEACGIRGKKRKLCLDQQAACRILESFFAQKQRPEPLMP